MHYAERYTDLADRGPDIRLSVARPEEVTRPPHATADQMDDVRAIIDTGAVICVIRQSYADDLGLQKHDDRPFGNSSDCGESPVYMVDLILKDGQRRRYEIVGAEFPRQDVELLLGRNFLEQANFAYDGPMGRYSLEIE